MIEAFSLNTAHRFADALASQARLRHRVFVERRALPAPTPGTEGVVPFAITAFPAPSSPAGVLDRRASVTIF